MKTMQQQKGMTAIGWLLIFALIAFFTLVAVKITPVYLNAFSVGSILSKMETEIGMGSKTPAEVTRIILTRLDVNMVRNLGRDDIYIERSGNIMLVEIDYEIRKDFMANIDLVFTFNEKAKIPIQ